MTEDDEPDPRLAQWAPPEPDPARMASFAVRVGRAMARYAAADTPGSRYPHGRVVTRKSQP
jgi:hypothetical protein